METLIQDLKQALRMFRDSPAFTATAVIALTLGIGVNTAIFSVANTVLLRPLPFPEPDRLVFVMNKSNDGVPITLASPANFMHWRAQADVLEDVAAWRNLSLEYSAGDGSATIVAGTVSADYFRVLRTPFAEGQGFSTEDNRPGAADTAVISHNFWMRRLNGDPDALGKAISLSGRGFVVIGIADQRFDVRDFGRPEVWVPLQLDSNSADQGLFLQVFARLKQGATLEQAQERLAVSLAAYRERFPDSMEATSQNPNHGFTALPVHEVIVRGARPMLLVLTGAVGLVLLIACANVANLLLVRAKRREREIAIRLALGAARWRIARHLLTESVLLSLTGGALGLVAGFLGVRALLSIDAAGLPRLGDAAELLGLDWRVAGFTLGLSIATGVFFGLVPALASTRADLNAVINHTGGRTGGGFGQSRTRSVLVTAEVGLAVVLVVGAALLIRTMLALSVVDMGFSSEKLLSMRTSLSDARFSSTASVAELTQSVLERVQSMPGVESVASSCCVPTQYAMNLPFDIVGRDDEGGYTGIAFVAPISPSYFETLGIPLLAGRSFDARDDGSGLPVIMIDQAMAERYWADGSDPLEGQVLVGGGAGVVAGAADEPVRQIVGIVGSMRAVGIHGDPGPTVYFPQAQTSDALNAVFVESAPIAWLVRTSVDPGTVATAVREEVSRVTGQPTTDVLVMDHALAMMMSPYRLNTWLMSLFGGSALLLAAVGIYGLIAYSVEQRRHEIGIRMALGAQASTLRSMLIRQGMLPVVIGVGAGLAAAYFLANVLASTLFGVEPRDLAVFVAVPVVLTFVGLAAVCVPAFRASRVDPTVALRYG
jgi:predicted permease